MGISKKEKKCPYCSQQVIQVKNDKKLEKILENVVKIKPELKKIEQEEAENIFRGEDVYNFHQEKPFNFTFDKVKAENNQAKNLFQVEKKPFSFDFGNVKSVNNGQNPFNSNLFSKPDFSNPADIPDDNVFHSQAQEYFEEVSKEQKSSQESESSLSVSKIIIPKKVVGPKLRGRGGHVIKGVKNTKEAREAQKQHSSSGKKRKIVSSEESSPKPQKRARK